MLCLKTNFTTIERQVCFPLQSKNQPNFWTEFKIIQLDIMTDTNSRAFEFVIPTTFLVHYLSGQPITVWRK
ncbi:hypothetical protein AAV32_16325 [Kerstersia gyiorum]|uniref:Uncharacterized protein n=1 Tax=Kerstersia gyiorum TaxID=206506 RepID=A0A171KNG8_9BURK|nr:hypothetical protein AAV32_16325 [Kerstersia gyiorum]